MVVTLFPKSRSLLATHRGHGETDGLATRWVFQTALRVTVSRTPHSVISSLPVTRGLARVEKIREMTCVCCSKLERHKAPTEKHYHPEKADGDQRG